MKQIKSVFLQYLFMVKWKVKTIHNIFTLLMCTSSYWYLQHPAGMSQAYWREWRKLSVKIAELRKSLIFRGQLCQQRRNWKYFNTCRECWNSLADTLTSIQLLCVSLCFIIRSPKLEPNHKVNVIMCQTCCIFYKLKGYWVKWTLCRGCYLQMIFLEVVWI